MLIDNAKYPVQRVNLFLSCTVSLYAKCAFDTFCLYKMFVFVSVRSPAKSVFDF